jgi:hypothetical protein
MPLVMAARSPDTPQYGADLVESGVKTISRPVIGRVIGPQQLGHLDEFACRQLDRLGSSPATPALQKASPFEDDLTPPALEDEGAMAPPAVSPTDGLRRRKRGKGKGASARGRLGTMEPTLLAQSPPTRPPRSPTAKVTSRRSRRRRTRSRRGVAGSRSSSKPVVSAPPSAKSR